MAALGEVMTQRSDFSYFWSRHYSQTPPLAWQVRQDWGENWFRIYSLPDGKRNPDHAEDWEVLLSRFRSVVSWVVGDQEPDMWLAIPVPAKDERSRYKLNSIQTIETRCSIKNISSDGEFF